MALIFEELFDYPSGTFLNGASGGTGFTGNWVCTTAGGLRPQTSTGDITKSGISAGSPTNACRFKSSCQGNNSTGYAANRTFTAVPNTVNGATYWLAVVVISNAAKGTTNFNLDNLTTDSAGTTAAQLWVLAGAFANVTPKCDGTVLYSGDGSTPHIVVYKIVMSGAALTPVDVYAYVDVDLNTDPSTWTPTVSVVATWYVTTPITRWAWGEGGAATTAAGVDYYMDNLRMATTSYEAGGYPAPSGNFFMFF